MNMEMLLTQEELAQELQISVWTLISWRRGDSGNLGPPYIQLGRSIRYRRSDVDEWLTKRTQETTEPRIAE